MKRKHDDVDVGRDAPGDINDKLTDVAPTRAAHPAPEAAGQIQQTQHQEQLTQHLQIQQNAQQTAGQVREAWIRNSRQRRSRTPHTTGAADPAAEPPDPADPAAGRTQQPEEQTQQVLEVPLLEVQEQQKTEVVDQALLILFGLGEEGDQDTQVTW